MKKLEKFDIEIIELENDEIIVTSPMSGSRSADREEDDEL